jgi:cellulose synthase/poly-beta-1,6-N-acetylglucosamine synthase-like glycosyltransferase
MFLEAIAALAAAIWLYLVLARGGFWLCSERHEGGPTTAPSWPAVMIVIPARNEADGIAETIGSLLRQDYAGPLKVILVDDDSSDGTAEIARRTAASLNASERLKVIDGEPLPRGWTGKLWAVKQGVAAAQ